MASITQMRQESLEKSILFMQKEHADTLKGLHEEIQKLQKKCSELTFQLAMETTSSPQEDLLREKKDQLEQELLVNMNKLAEKEQELELKDKKIGDLQLKLKAQEKGFKDKLAYLNQVVAKYKRQAEESSAQNADVLLQNHRQNVIRASLEFEKSTIGMDLNQGAQIDSPQGHLRTSSASSSSSQGSRTKTPPKIKPALTPHAPVESKESRPQSRNKYRQRSKMGNFEVPEGHPVLRDADLKSRTGRRLSYQDEVVPDPRPFLQVTRDQKMTLQQSADLNKQPSKPLPPIANSRLNSETLHGSPRVDMYSPKPPPTRRDPQLVPSPHKANSADFKKLKERSKSSPQNIEVEMQTLVLDDITKSSLSSLRKAQEYGSD